MSKIDAAPSNLNRRRTILTLVLSLCALSQGAHGQANVQGEWGAVMPWPNVAVHTSLLPDGRVFFFTRRPWNAGGTRPTGTLDAQSTAAFIWDPATPAQPPATVDTTVLNTSNIGRVGYNIFCAGHAFLPDGRLFIAGGHVTDTNGRNLAAIFDYKDQSWTILNQMSAPRWYPTVVALPNGDMLTVGGIYQNSSQVWSNGNWSANLTTDGSYLDPEYPRLFLLRDGRVFSAGRKSVCAYYDPLNGGAWRRAPATLESRTPRTEGSAVMYAPNRILIMGGNKPPTNSADKLDHTAADPRWTPAANMLSARRQFCSTLLADGQVFVNGGMSSNAQKPDEFNDYSSAVFTPEVWDPGADRWTRMAPEEKVRGYHATSLLLPDGRVLSAGGGEWQFKSPDPDDLEQRDNQFYPTEANPMAPSQPSAQIFSPPYLFTAGGQLAVRPVIQDIPATITYGSSFKIDSPDAAGVRKISFIRIGTVTHSMNLSQTFCLLQHAVANGRLEVSAPTEPNVNPPGHYMVFLINDQGVPSVAKIVQLLPFDGEFITVQKLEGGVAHLGISLKPVCPYGIQSCWPVMEEKVRGVEGVLPGPEAIATRFSTSMVLVKMSSPDLPDLATWKAAEASSNGNFAFRGVELTLEGCLKPTANGLQLTSPKLSAPVELVPLTATLQADPNSGQTLPIPESERAAMERLSEALVRYRNLLDAGKLNIQVVGPYDLVAGHPQLQVRAFRLCTEESP